MVKSSVIKATEMNKMVFDQSIVGVFPRKEKYFNYVLGLINSDIGNKIIHLINPTANNSANYLKKIPFILPNESQLDKINQIVKKLKLNPIDADLQQRLDDTFDEIYYSYTPSKTEYLF